MDSNFLAAKFSPGRIQTIITMMEQCAEQTFLACFPGSNMEGFGVYFSQRDSTIEEIQNLIRDETQSIILLYGFGGMGKSEIAKRWAQKYYTTCNFVWCFDATNELTLQHAFLLLKRYLMLGHHAVQGPLPEFSSIFKAWSDQLWSAVFIFDNANGATAADILLLRRFLTPEGSRVRLIVTSRVGGDSWSELGRPCVRLLIRGLSPDESYDFFLQYLPLQRPIGYWTHQMVMSLLERNAGYPLGLKILAREILKHMACETPQDVDYIQLTGAFNTIVKNQTIETLSTSCMRSEEFIQIFDDTLTVMKSISGGRATQIFQCMTYLQLNPIDIRLIIDIVRELYLSPRPRHEPENYFLSRSFESCQKGLRALEAVGFVTTTRFTQDMEVVETKQLEKLFHSSINFYQLCFNSLPECFLRTIIYDLVNHDSILKNLVKMSKFFEMTEPSQLIAPHIDFLLNKWSVFGTMNIHAVGFAILRWRLMQLYVATCEAVDVRYCLELLHNISSHRTCIGLRGPGLIYLTDATINYLYAYHASVSAEDLRPVFLEALALIHDSHNGVNSEEMQCQSHWKNWTHTCCILLLEKTSPTNDVRME